MRPTRYAWTIAPAINIIVAAGLYAQEPLTAFIATAFYFAVVANALALILIAGAGGDGS